MKRIFGVSGAKAEKTPAPTIDETTGRLGTRGDALDEKISKLDAQLVKYRDQIKKCRPGPAQEGLKRRALQVMKQRKMYEGQREQLYNQQFTLEQAAFSAETAKDSVETVRALKTATKEMSTLMHKNKELDIDGIDKLTDEMAELQYMNEEIQEALGRSYGIPDDIDESDLMDELEALDSELAMEGAAANEEGVPSYLADLPEVPEAEPVPAAPQAQEIKLDS